MCAVHTLTRLEQYLNHIKCVIGASLCSLPVYVSMGNKTNTNTALQTNVFLLPFCTLSQSMQISVLPMQEPLYWFNWLIFSCDVVVASLKEMETYKHWRVRIWKHLDASLVKSHWVSVLLLSQMGLDTTGLRLSFLPSSHSSSHWKHRRTAFMSISSIPFEWPAEGQKT